MRRRNFSLLCLNATALKLLGQSGARPLLVALSTSCSSGGGPTPTLLSASSIANAAGASPATTAAIDTTGATLIVACVTGYSIDSGTNGILVDSAGNTWSKLTDPGQGPSVNSNSIWWVANPTTSATHTITVTSNFPAIALAAFSNTKVSSPQDQTPTGSFSAAAQTRQPGSITPCQDLDLVITCGVNGGSANQLPSIDSSMTLIVRQTDNAGGRNALAFYYKVVTPAAAFNPTYSSNQGSNSNIQVVETSFKNQ